MDDVDDEGQLDAVHRRAALAVAAEARVYDQLNAETSHDPLVLAGQIVGLLAAAESLLALLPSSKMTHPGRAIASPVRSL